MVVAKKYILAKHVEGVPTKADIIIVEEKLPELKNGEYLAEAVFISVDPYMRQVMKNFKIGDTMVGSQVAKIIKSKSAKFPEGKYISGNLGWRTYTVVHEDYETSNGWGHPILLPFGDEVPLSLGVGMLGMPGNTAYFGFTEVCRPKSGETLVVSGAGGAVGSIVGQVAKIKGLKVIGISGSDKKNQWLKSLGYDHVINYKTQDIGIALEEAAPQGIDCYFDNVGGEISSTVINHMNSEGRIAVCGAISGYNEKNLPKATVFQWTMVIRHLEMRGFSIVQYAHRWNEGVLQLLQWIKEGKLKYKETITEGFENMVEAFAGMLQGDNIGKAVVKI